MCIAFEHVVDESPFYDFIVCVFSRIWKMGPMLPRPELDIIGPAERVKFGEFVTVFVDG